MRRCVSLVSLLLAVASPAVRAESLFDESKCQALAADRKAFRVGDAITVQVYENSSATSTTDTSTQRRNNLDGSLRLLNGKQWGASAGVSGDFAGGGATQRANRLLATLTVRVQQVLANGDLQVAGEQALTVNEEQHKVKVEGRVRPQDISADNVVLSTRLADARIEYVGSGELSQRQRRAWWRKILDWLGF